MVTNLPFHPSFVYHLFGTDWAYVRILVIHSLLFWHLHQVTDDKPPEEGCHLLHLDSCISLQIFQKSGIIVFQFLLAVVGHVEDAPCRSELVPMYMPVG